MKLLTLSISKNLSNKDTKVAVSCAFSPPVSTKALLTDSLRTYQGNLQHDINNIMYEPGQQDQPSSLQKRTS